MISCCTLIILKLDPAEEDHEKERISVEEANRPFPVPKDGITFESLIRNRDEVEYFKEFLNKKHNRGEGKGLEGEGGGEGVPTQDWGSACREFEMQTRKETISMLAEAPLDPLWLLHRYIKKVRATVILKKISPARNVITPYPFVIHWKEPWFFSLNYTYCTKNPKWGLYQ